MPELPEVETIRAQLDKGLRGKKIAAVQVLYGGRLRPSTVALTQGVTGRTIESVERRAKLLIWRLDHKCFLLAHLKMTGRFIFVPAEYHPGKHDHVIFYLSDHGNTSRLVWSDVRKFGYLELADDKKLTSVLATYGPEPLLSSPETLANRLVRPKTRSLKAALLNQATIAGIGNIYADEACHRAGLRPMRRLASLSSGERLRLAREVQQVLKEAVKQHGTSADDYVDTRGERGDFQRFLRVYGRKGQPCPVCRTPIKKTVHAQRGTHYCPKCQK